MAPARLLAAALLAAGCGRDLLPGERVLPGEVRAEAWYGDPDSELGVAVAARGERIAMAAGDGWVGEAGEDGWSGRPPGAVRLWFRGGELLAGIEGEGVRAVPGGELLWRLPEARVVAGEEDVWIAATASGVLGSGGRSWDLPDARTVFAGCGRLLALACGDGCAAWELADGDAVRLGDAGDGGAVACWDGVAWWSDPELESEQGRGVVCSEDGRQVRGLPGDHLGRAIGGGFAAGQPNTGLVPRRLRLVSLDGAGTIALDRFGGSRPPALGGDGATLVVGVPSWPGPDPGAGAVFAVGW